MAKRNRRHAFLFRHCIRGTNDDTGESPAESLSSYLTEPLPDWHTAEHMGCTRRGLKVMEGEGQTLGRQLREEMTVSGKRRLRLRFVVDPVTRDSDTTLALIRGFNGIFDRNELDATVTYDQDLFSPLVGPRMSFGLKKSMEVNATSFCEQRYTDETLQKELEHRLDTLPRPEGNMHTILKAMAALTGSNKWIEGDRPDLISVNINKKGEPNIQGKVNALKALGQTLFYSRASNMPEFMNTTVDTETLYRLLEWSFWFESVREMANSRSATYAAPLASHILEALRPSSGQGDDDDTLTAYLYIGHDTNINRIASVFGLRYDLGAPYFTSAAVSGMLAPAPVGSTMHFVHNIDDATVELSFLYPVLIELDGRIHSDGRLETIGMKKRNSPNQPLVNDEDLTRKRRMSVFGDPESDDKGLEMLEERLVKNLLPYEGALECFLKGEKLPSWPKKSAGPVPEDALSSQDIDQQRIDFFGIVYKRILHSTAVALASLLVISIFVFVRRQIWRSDIDRANEIKRQRMRSIARGGGQAISPNAAVAGSSARIRRVRSDDSEDEVAQFRRGVRSDESEEGYQEVELIDSVSRSEFKIS